MRIFVPIGRSGTPMKSGSLETRSHSWELGGQTLNREEGREGGSRWWSLAEIVEAEVGYESPSLRTDLCYFKRNPSGSGLKACCSNSSSN